MDKLKLEELVSSWEFEAVRLLRKSDDTYARLRTGSLPQEDTLVYSVYEDQMSGWTYKACAMELKKLLEGESS